MSGWETEALMKPQAGDHNSCRGTVRVPASPLMTQMEISPVLSQITPAWGEKSRQGPQQISQMTSSGEREQQGRAVSLQNSQTGKIALLSTTLVA